MRRSDGVRRTVALETLGCKVNQYESSYLLQTLEEASYRTVSFRDRADVYIVHSCAVTSKAAFQTRQLLRRARRINPQALIVAAGCDAQLEPDRLAAEQLATHILGTAEKFRIVEWLKSPGSFANPRCAHSDSRLYGDCHLLPTTHMHSGRARAYLKVQDGCDAYCSYCVVPFTRGRSRSLPADEVRAQMGRFVDHHYSEVVLTGIHLGQWGKDFNPPRSLPHLLQLLSEGPLPPRLRLSSLEPIECNEALLDVLSASSRICPHFHVPLQSGDREVLERMRRPYTPAHYAEVIGHLRALFPDAALGADVLVGFPGETESQFQNTCQLISRLPLTYLHVFPFSPRPGTAADRLPGRIAGNELRRRAKALRDLDVQKRTAFRERFLGRWMEVLVETQVEPGWWQGTSPNYLQIRFPGTRQLTRGSLIHVRPTRKDRKGLVADQPPAIPS